MSEDGREKGAFGVARRLFAVVVIVAAMSASLLAAPFELGERTLSYGSWGADVFHLQQLLVRAGYAIDVDGHYGSGTRRAVTAFQLAAGLEPDGVAGSKTIHALLSMRPTVEYIVQAGDSLWSIAQTFDTTMEELIATNNLPAGPLLVGQRLFVPVQPTYVVRSGDTLSEIALRFGTTVAVLAQINDIANPSLIRVGQTLHLPRGSEFAVPGF